MTSTSARPPIVDPVVLAQLYSRNVAHKACVDAKTANCVGLGWELKPKRDADPDKAAEQAEVLEDFLNLCARRDGKTLTELLTSARKDEEAVGWAAIEITRNGKGRVDGLFHIHAYTLRRRKDRDGWVQKVQGEYRYFRDYGTQGGGHRRPGALQRRKRDPGLGRGLARLPLLSHARPRPGSGRHPGR